MVLPTLVTPICLTESLESAAKQLRNWVANKEKISGSKEGTFRVRKERTFIQEPELERL